ncbi:MAG TPA: precorrin-8X methylmutase [Candidatus Dormibacteraeota bacterium]|jgi:precorrin-8X/cobalt-precorrin-8 methylmutase|nr:precorrin-8X methylmutase [Candidatus Dormibacteraeota bacterium]
MSGSLKTWPHPGGLLERLGVAPDEIERGSRAAARQSVGARWVGAEADLAACLVYAAGDASLASLIEIGNDPVGNAVRALREGAPILVDVSMVRAGLRSGDRPVIVAVDQIGASDLALSAGTTRSAAGVEIAWSRLQASPVVALGNAPTALLAVLDNARVMAPACVIATCPGFQIAAEAKAELSASKTIPHLAVAGTVGGSGLAVAALNFLLGLADGA